MYNAYEIFNDIKAIRNLIKPTLKMQIVKTIPRFIIRDAMDERKSHYCVIFLVNNIHEFEHRYILHPYRDFNDVLRCYMLFDDAELLDREYMKYLVKRCAVIKLLSVSGF